jgi:hypothetical protein
MSRRVDYFRVTMFSWRVSDSLPARGHPWNEGMPEIVEGNRLWLPKESMPKRYLSAQALRYNRTKPVAMLLGR